LTSHKIYDIDALGIDVAAEKLLRGLQKSLQAELTENQRVNIFER